MKKKQLLSAVVFTLLVVSCGQAAESPTPTEVALEPTETASPTVVDTVELALADRIQTFEQEIEPLLV